MIPNTLDQWNEASILELLQKHYYECEYFDFKQMLSRDDLGKLRLRQSCCAFANSIGGFLVFGIDDDATKLPEARLIGLSPYIDFPEQFGNFPKECSPSVDWNFRNPPIVLGSGNVIHIAHIPKSWIAPHACKDSSGPWCFYKRTNKGNEPMSVEEIRMEFLGYYEKRLKLQLLRSELQHIIADSVTMLISDKDKEVRFSTNMFDLHVLESVLTDTYSIIAHETELVTTLHWIRRTCKSVNRRTVQHQSDRANPMTSDVKAQLTSEHNFFVHIACGQIEDYCSRAMNLLKIE